MNQRVQNSVFLRRPSKVWFLDCGRRKKNADKDGQPNRTETGKPGYYGSIN
jgi:hypothetical protein